jgi:hypothetical protein
VPDDAPWADLMRDRKVRRGRGTPPPYCICEMRPAVRCTASRAMGPGSDADEVREPSRHIGFAMAALKAAARPRQRTTRRHHHQRTDEDPL